MALFTRKQATETEEQRWDLRKQLRWPPGMSPFEQANIWMSAEPYEWQARILREVAIPGSRVIVSTCNESGKTSELVPCIGLSFMAAFPGAQVLSTAGAERQVKDQLFKYLEGKLLEYPGWKVSREQMKISAPSVCGLPPSEWLSYVPRDALTAEGFHSSWATDSNGVRRYLPTMYIIDEAKSVKQALFEAMFRIDPDMAFVISSPGEDTGPFFNGLRPLVDSREM